MSSSSAAAAAAAAAATKSPTVTLKFATSSWTDPTLASCGRFFPRGTASKDRLRFYTKQLPSVEVNTSSYAIPQKNVHAEWAKEAPEGFVFHFKTYGLLTLLNVSVNALPWQVKDKLPDILKLKESVSQADLGDELVELCFSVQNEAFGPFYDAGKMGSVVFQFQANFKKSDEAWAYVTRCRSLLDPRYPMAIEFRATSWFLPQENLNDTIARCKAAQITLIGVDELIESEQSKYSESQIVIGSGISSTKPSASMPKKLFVCTQTVPSQIYIRAHRRYGEERRLSDDELIQWRDALEQVAGQCTQDTTIWFVWNTNFEDHSFVNARRLAKLLEDQTSSKITVTDWKAVIREREKSDKSSILGFFSAPKKKADTNSNSNDNAASSSTKDQTKSANVASSDASNSSTSKKQKESPSQAIQSPKRAKTMSTPTKKSATPDKNQRSISDMFRKN